MIHDFMAFLASLAIGILVSFTQPLVTSFSVFMLSFSIWLLATSTLARAEHKAVLDPGISRASLGGMLLLTSTLLIAYYAGLEARVIALLTITVVAALTVYVYYLSRRPALRR